MYTIMEQVKQSQIDKTNTLDIRVSGVFVAKNAKKRAFIEQFEYSSVNFTQKNLGTILGFFIVRDSNSSSENIVNFLASEIKKKYFSTNNKKTPEEKFELTLHHINRVLEEIANIGNVEWLGHIDGAVCVVSENNVHFSVTGNAHVLLLRQDILINISEGLASTEASEHPLKTFVDISSGTLQADDKLIITSQELLDLIPFEELQKNAIRFNCDDFIQFVNTALTNECSMATATIIDVKKPKIRKVKNTENSPTKIKTSKNAFSAKTYENSEQTESKEIKSKTELDNIIKEQIHKEEYVDPRTGHIHMQATENISSEKSATFMLIKEKISDIQEITVEFFKKQKYNLSKKSNNLLTKSTDTSSKTTKETPSTVDNISISKKELIINNLRRLRLTAYKASKVAIVKSKTFFQSFVAKCVYFFKKIRQKEKKLITQNDSAKNIKKYSFLPSFHHLIQIWHTMRSETKMTTVGLLIFIIITPLLIAKLFNTSPKTKPDTSNIHSTNQQKQDFDASTAKQASDITNLITPHTLLDNKNMLSALLLNDKIFAVTQSAIIAIDNSKENSEFPTNEKIALATEMNDLDLLFLLTDSGHLYSFSPTIKRFTNQTNIPTLNSTEISAINTFMTYLYVVKNNNIIRYARIENGFGNEKKWLKEKVDLSNLTSFAVDENIYITKDGDVLKFTKGKRQDFTLNENNIYAESIYTTESTKFLWLLDSKNKHILKISKSDNKILSKYDIEDIKNKIKSFVVNENTQTAIIATPDKVLSFTLNK